MPLEMAYLAFTDRRLYVNVEALKIEPKTSVAVAISIVHEQVIARPFSELRN